MEIRPGEYARHDLPERLAEIKITRNGLVETRLRLGVEQRIVVLPVSVPNGRRDLESSGVVTPGSSRYTIGKCSRKCITKITFASVVAS